MSVHHAAADECAPCRYAYGQRVPDSAGAKELVVFAGAIAGALEL